MTVDRDEIARRERIVVEDYDGILPYCEAFYFEAILYSASCAVDAFSRYERALADHADWQPARIVSAVHESLGHAAALSRFFWPAQRTRYVKLSAARGAKLRAIFAVEDQSPLATRKLRNVLEHFDERLDEFCLVTGAALVIPGPMIGAKGWADEPVARVFKALDPSSEEVVILGESFPFGPIRKEVARIHALAQSLLQ